MKSCPWSLGTGRPPGNRKVAGRRGTGGRRPPRMPGSRARALRRAGVGCGDLLRRLQLQVADHGPRQHPANWWGSYGTQVPTLQRMAIRILSLTSSSSGCERNWSCFEDYNNRTNGKKMKAKKNQKMDPLLSTEANHAQGWLVEGGDEEDAEPVCGLTWKLIEEACGVEECGNLRRSARLAQMRDVDDDDFHSEAEEEQINEDEIDFESDQEDVVPIVGDEDEGESDD